VSTNADGEKTEEASPKFLEIWRPQPANRGNANRPRENANKGGKGKQRFNKNDKADGKGKRPTKSAKSNHNSKPKEQKMDPDSPFAKLAALKAGLKK